MTTQPPDAQPGSPRDGSSLFDPDPPGPPPEASVMRAVRLLEERRRRRKVVVATVLVTVLVAAAAFLIGVSLVQCLLLVTAGTTVGAVLLAVHDLDDDPGLPSIYDAGDTAGTRREVSRLSWVMVGHDNRVGSAPFHRLRQIAATRLALRGIDLSSPEGDRTAQDLLGPVGYRVLVAEATTAPTSRVFEECLTRLERLDPDPQTVRGPAR